MALIKYGSGLQYGTGRLYGQTVGVGPILFDGATAAVSTTQGSIKTTKKVVSLTSTSSLLQGSINRIKHVAGPLAAVSHVLGQAKRRRKLACLLVVHSTLGARFESKKPVVGDSVIHSNVVGVCNANWNLFTTSIIKYGPDKKFGTGWMFGQHQAIFLTVTAAAATIFRTRNLAGSILTTSTLQLRSEIPLSGLLGATSSLSGHNVSAILLKPYYLVESAYIEGSIKETKKVSSHLTSISFVAGSLKLKRKLQGFATATTSVTATLLNLQLLSCNLKASASLSGGTIKRRRHFASHPSSVASLTSNISVARDFVGRTIATAAMSGGIKEVKKLGGLQASNATFAGQMLRFKYLLGSYNSIATFEGLMIPLDEFSGSIAAHGNFVGTSSIHWNLYPATCVKYGEPVKYGADWKYGQHVAVLANSNVTSTAKAGYKVSAEIVATSFLELVAELRITSQIEAISQLNANLKCYKEDWSTLLASSSMNANLEAFQLCYGNITTRASLNGFTNIAKKLTSNLNAQSLFLATSFDKLRLIRGRLDAASDFEALMLRLKVMLGAILAAQSVFGLVERIEPIAVEGFFYLDYEWTPFIERINILSEVQDDFDTPPTLSRSETIPSIFDITVDLHSV